MLCALTLDGPIWEHGVHLYEHSDVDKDGNSLIRGEYFLI